MHLGLEVLLTGMTQITVLDVPGDLAVMAGTTETPIDDIGHLDLVTACLELEAKVSMANLAGEADTVKPVRENYRSYTGLGGIIIDYDVTVFCTGILTKRTRGDNNQ